MSNINVSKRLYGFVYGEKIDTQSFKNIENQTDYTYLYMFLLFKQKSGLDFFDINAPKSFVLDGSTSIAVHLILITNTILGALVCIRMYSDILPYLHVILVQIIHIERRREGYTKYKNM